MKRTPSMHLATVLAMLLGTFTATHAQAGKAHDTLVWTSEKELATIDPYFGFVKETLIIALYTCDMLLNFNPDKNEFEPLLAKNYKWIDDKTVEFDLREDVTFHDGQKFTAEDVKYTFDHITTPGIGVLGGTYYDWLEKTEVVSPYKVRLIAKKPSPVALTYLANLMPILPKGHYDNAPSYQGKKNYGAVKLNCTGPYKVVSAVPGQSASFVANPNYFSGAKGKPKIGKIVFRTILDVDAAIAELVTGGVDWVWNIAKDKADALKGMNQVTIVEGPAMRVRYVMMNTVDQSANNPFKDIRVRRAVAHAINANAIAKNLVGEKAEQVYSVCHPKQFGCYTDVPKYAFDPQKARQLLTEAGYPNGFSTDIYSFRERPWTEAVINDLRKVGINANLRYLQYATVRQALRNGEAKIADQPWGSFGIADASAFTSYFFNGGPDDINQDPDLHKWLTIADSSIDPNVRKENYKNALTRIAEQAYWQPLYTYTLTYGLSKDLDFKPDFDETPRFYQSGWK